MPLTYLLYRCPRCGHDPMAGEKDQAKCLGCGAAFARGEEKGVIRVTEASGADWTVPAPMLTAAMDHWRDRDGWDRKNPEELIREAAVTMRRSASEAPVWLGGELLGFAESMGETSPGMLELTGESLRFSAEPQNFGRKSGAAPVLTWSLLDIRAVQTSSSSLQFSPLEGGLMEFRFLGDSPFRWEGLLREVLRTAFRRAGLGEIVEFQPRVVTE